MLNPKSLRTDLPPLERLYQPDDYRRTQEYVRTDTRFDFMTATISLGFCLFSALLAASIALTR